MEKDCGYNVLKINLLPKLPKNTAEIAKLIKVK